MTEIALTAIYQAAEEGGYIGYIAELPSANTQAETMEEVRENLVDAMQMILEANPATLTSPRYAIPHIASLR